MRRLLMLMCFSALVILTPRMAGAAEEVTAASLYCVPLVPVATPLNDTPLTSKLQIVNAGATPGTYSIQYFNAGGVASWSDQFVVSPGASLTIDTDSITPGLYHAVVAATTPSLVFAYIHDTVSDVWGFYQGQPCAGALTYLYLPFQWDIGAAQSASVLALMNGSTVTRTLDIALYTAEGVPVHTLAGVSLPPSARLDFDSQSLPATTTVASGTGYVRVLADDEGVRGVLATPRENGDYFFENEFATTAPVLASAQAGTPGVSPASPASNMAALPVARLLTADTRWDALIVVSAQSAAPTVVSMNYYLTSGAQAAPSKAFTLNGGEVKQFPTWQDFSLPGENISVITGASSPITIGATYYPYAPSAYSLDAATLAPASASQLIPVVSQETLNTIWAVQNTSGAMAAVSYTYYNAQGAPVATGSRDVAPGASLIMNALDEPLLARPFTGIVQVASTQALMGWAGLLSRRAGPPVEPPTSVAVDGPATGTIETNYTFTAVVSPPTVTLPVTLTWTVSDMFTQTQVLSEVTGTLTVTWGTAGGKIVTVAATNSAGSASASPHFVAITAPSEVPPAAVAIDGPGVGAIDVTYTFTVYVSPPTVTLPVTLTWAMTDMLTQTQVVSTPISTLALAWSSPGAKVITVEAANNAGGAVAARHPFTVAIALTPITPTASATIVYTDTQSNAVRVEVPQGAVAQPVTLALLPLANPSAHTSAVPPANLLSFGVQLVVYEAGAQLDAFDFAAPITLTFGYSQALLAGISPYQLLIARQVGATWADAAISCTPASAYALDASRNTLRVGICTTGAYVLAHDDRAIFLPVAAK